MNKLTFKVIEDNTQQDKLGSHKGFVNSIISAYLDGQEVGYLKVTRLDRNTFFNLNPNLWVYMKNWQGWLGIKDNEPIDNNVDEILRYVGCWSEDIKKMSLTEKLSYIKQNEPKYQEQMNKTIDFLLINPLSAMWKFINHIEVKE